MQARIRRAAAAVLLLLYGSLPIASAAGTLVPVGQTVGLELKTSGVYVLKFEGEESPAQVCGLKVGDRIVSVDGHALTQAEQLRTAVAESEGEELILDVDRDGKALRLSVFPEAAEGGWQIGVFLQDRISGLGTVTFYDPDTGLFGALGHGVNEAGGSRPLFISKGSAMDARITEVQKGSAGTPGCLKGCAGSGGLLGTVEKNTSAGLFGHALSDCWNGEPLPVAELREITTGPAEIWSSAVGGEIRHYGIRIEELCFDAENGRNLKLRVTDPGLLGQTGGIVQGMSGSPIIQNGRLVGAVTHVLVHDPTRGYGILIGNMLEACCEDSGQKAA